MLLNRDQQLADALYEQDYGPENVHGRNSNYAYGMPSQMSIRPHGLASQAKQQNLANSLKRSYWEGWVKPNSTAGNTTSTAGPLPSDTAAAAAAATIGQLGQNHIGLGYPSDSNGKRIRPAYGGPPYPKKKKTGGPKILNANSMTPAALVHQLFNGIQESYEHNPRNKTYRCTLVVLNQQFEMDASSKKEAKQKAAELAVRTLRPDIPLSTGSAIIKPIGVVNPASVGGTPIVASSSKLPVAKGVVVVSGSGSNPTPISAYGSTSGVVCTRNTDQMESIVDYMFQLIANRFNGLHNPSYDVVETTSRELGPSEAHKKTYKCTLTFPEEGKTFVNIGYGKEAQKEICARKALTSLLGVSKDEVHKIIKGIALTKLRPDGTYISALHQIAATFRCELEVKVHHAEPTYEQKVEVLRKNIPAQTPAVAVYKITDYAEEGKVTKFTSRSYSTQQEAKEAAAAEALKKYFRVDMANLEKEKLEYQKMKKALQLHTPSQRLNERIQQRRALALNEKEKNMEATYEEIGIDPRTGHHKMKVSIDGQSFIGSGESRKIAKNQAALFAMRTLFKMEEVPKGPQKLSIPQSQLPCSKLCFEINEFSKIEYLNMCQYYGIKPSSWFAVFLLVNEKNEKRVLSMAGSNGAVLQGNQFLVGLFLHDDFNDLHVVITNELVIKMI
ncbi:hypothetical protein WR25_18849 [Diploscapter pachys]|uniref:DRBM domain-containing protein n=1 Tax=Diploscapter pachys TaxID=2018661 RepID=A0A2A2KA98_9BILA|nr:hypothetical protein WR25_18849 [Diploscapter pachys]